MPLERSDGALRTVRPSGVPSPPGPHFPDEERAEVTARLLSRIAASDDDRERGLLREEVVVLNMGVARAIAHRYRQRGMNLDDLIQVAYVGLVKAVRGFDEEYEKDFLSYAVPTISGEVKKLFRDFGWTVRPPRRVQELQGRIARASSDLAHDLGRSPRPGEVAAALKVDEDAVLEALAADGCFTPSSLDVPVGEDGSATLGQLLADEHEHYSAAEARVMLAPAVRRLEERDRRILELRFFHGWTQEQIAADIGVTQMQVSRLLSRIIAELRQELMADERPS